jgi:hypothetical protein
MKAIMQCAIVMLMMSLVFYWYPETTPSLAMQMMMAVALIVFFNMISMMHRQWRWPMVVRAHMRVTDCTHDGLIIVKPRHMRTDQYRSVFNVIDHAGIATFGDHAVASIRMVPSVSPIDDQHDLVPSLLIVNSQSLITGVMDNEDIMMLTKTSRTGHVSYAVVDLQEVASDAYRHRFHDRYSLILR